MLIDPLVIQKHLRERNIRVKGVLHVGAHDCEELPFYQNNIASDNIVWLEANPEKVESARRRGITGVYHAVITNRVGEEVVFHVANNGHSSSVLEMGTHVTEHPHVWYNNQIHLVSDTLTSFFEKHPELTVGNFWNFDIQGAEGMALEGGETLLEKADALYLEINERELYRGCMLLPEMDAWLLARGFDRVVTHMTPHGWGDALYLRHTHTH